LGRNVEPILLSGLNGARSKGRLHSTMPFRFQPAQIPSHCRTCPRKVARQPPEVDGVNDEINNRRGEAKEESLGGASEYRACSPIHSLRLQPSAVCGARRFPFSILEIEGPRKQESSLGEKVVATSPFKVPVRALRSPSGPFQRALDAPDASGSNFGLCQPPTRHDARVKAFRNDPDRSSVISLSDFGALNIRCRVIYFLVETRPRGLRNRTPDPPPFSAIDSIPADSIAARILSAVPSRPPSSPSTHSSRATVGSDTFDRSAKSAWDHPSNARAAFIWRVVTKRHISHLIEILLTSAPLRTD
jgi:hypothetical protein